MVRELGRTSSKPEKFGVDFMWMTAGRWYGVQRKLYPEDFEASLADGRLSKELGQIASIDQAFFVVEGYGEWTTNGKPMGKYSRLDKGAMFSLLTSISLIYNVPTYRVRNQQETIQLVQSLKRWTEKPEHMDGRSSLDRRPTTQKSRWGTVDSEAWGSHFLQGFDGVGPVQSRAIIKAFGGVPLRWSFDDMSELEKVKGIGKKTAEKLWTALGGG